MSALSISSDEQHDPVLGLERLPQLALLDVVANVADAVVAELGVAQPGHGVVLVEALQRLGLGLDVPGDEAQVQGLGDLLGEQRLAGARLALDQKGPLELHGGVHGHGQFVGRDVGVGGAVENHAVVRLGS